MLSFNQYESNIKLYGEGKINLQQEKLIEHFIVKTRTVLTKILMLK